VKLPGFHHSSFGRTGIGILVCVVLSIVFASSTHLVPQGSRQLITVNHQMRRVLSRAERENLKSVLAFLSPAPTNDAAPAIFERVRLYVESHPRAVFRGRNLPEQPNSPGIFLSPVLNL
jgi:regulator of protease activity HflC (stomatin/prohibitin superfamily)